jgi:hypothetical protein
MNYATKRGCLWCAGLPCRGVGYLNSAGAGDPCGAQHAGFGSTVEEEIASHKCDECGKYVCGIHTLSGGVCPDCGDPDEAREVLDSGQAQPEEARNEDD